MKIIGREYELKQLQKSFDASESAFITIYGRRRIGKTYLVREFFKEKKCIFFRATGIHKASLKRQLASFKKEIETTFYQNRKGTKLSHFSNWHDAFDALKDAIDIFSGKQKVVLFLDEVPWMATPRSGLIEALDYYWNRYWSEDKRIKLIICGSAASWIIENILQDTGGLHNRVTLRLPLNPFTLNEVKDYLIYKGVNYDHDQILTIYMCLGGVPFYLNFIERGLSAIQNINNACFKKKGTLYDEFELLFASLFKKHKIHEKLITFIASKRQGMSRSEIENHSKSKGGRLTERLRELEEAGFIGSFIAWQKERGLFYKIIDEYTLFYLSWIAPRAESRISHTIDDHYWDKLSSSASWKAWSGYAFESVCIKHITKIKKALHIPEGSEISTWRYYADKKEKEDGIQIDLVIDRPDNCINLCEIKYCNAQFNLDKNYASKLIYREKIYRKVTKTKKQIFHSFIASNGLKKTMYSEELIATVATLRDLF